MTTYGFCFRPVHGKYDCRGRLVLWIADYKGRTRLIPTAYEILHTEWDPVEGTVVIPGDDGETGLERRVELMRYAAKMARDLCRISEIVDTLEQRGRYTADDIVHLF